MRVGAKACGDRAGIVPILRPCEVGDEGQHLFRVLLPCPWCGWAWRAVRPCPRPARIEAIPLELTMPERYQVAEVLEPIRRVTLVAPADGMIRGMEVRWARWSENRRRSRNSTGPRQQPGSRWRGPSSRKSRHWPRAAPRSRRSFRHRSRRRKHGSSWPSSSSISCTLRAPFSGRVMALPVCTGQYVMKGATIAELADVTSFKALQPVDRRTVTVGSPLTVQIEGHEVAAKVQAILPLPETFATLRELARRSRPRCVAVPNVKGDLEPGLRVQTALDSDCAGRRDSQACDQVGGRTRPGSRDAAGDPQRLRHQRAGPSPGRYRSGSGTDLRPAPHFRFAHRFLVGPLAPGDAGPIRRRCHDRRVEGPPDPSSGGAEAGIAAGRYQRAPVGPAGTGRARNPEPTSPGRHRGGSDTVLIRPVQPILIRPRMDREQRPGLSGAAAYSGRRPFGARCMARIQRSCRWSITSRVSCSSCCSLLGIADHGRDRAEQPGRRRRLRLGWLFLDVVVSSAIRLAAQWEKAVVFRLGKFQAIKGPGLFMIIPLIDQIRMVDTRVLAVNIPKQQVITRDNVPVTIDGVLFFRVENAAEAIIMVQDYRYMIAQYAQTSLRDVIGQMTLDQLLTEREEIAKSIEQHVEKDTKGWGLEVTGLRIQDIDMPEELKKMMSRQASAEREKRATITKAEGDKEAAVNLAAGGQDHGREPGRDAAPHLADDRRPGPDRLQHRRPRRADRSARKLRCSKTPTAANQPIARPRHRLEVAPCGRPFATRQPHHGPSGRCAGRQPEPDRRLRAGAAVCPRADASWRSASIRDRDRESAS